MNASQETLYFYFWVMYFSKAAVCDIGIREGDENVRRIPSNVKQEVLFTVPSRQVMQSISAFSAPYGASRQLSIENSTFHDRTLHRSRQGEIS